MADENALVYKYVWATVEEDGDHLKPDYDLHPEMKWYDAGKKLAIGVPIVICNTFKTHSYDFGCVYNRYIYDADWKHINPGHSHEPANCCVYVLSMPADKEDDCECNVPVEFIPVKRTRYIEIMYTTPAYSYHYRYDDTKLVQITKKSVCDKEDFFCNKHSATITVADHPDWADSGEIPIPPSEVSRFTCTEVFSEMDVS